MIEVYNSLMAKQYGLHIILTIAMYCALFASCAVMKLVFLIFGFLSVSDSKRRVVARCAFPRIDLFLIMFPMFPTILAEGICKGFTAPMYILVTLGFMPFLHVVVTTIDALFFGVVLIEDGLMLSSLLWLSRKVHIKHDDLASVECGVGSISPVNWLRVRTCDGKKYILPGEWVFSVDKINRHLAKLTDANDGVKNGN